MNVAMPNFMIAYYVRDDIDREIRCDTMMPTGKPDEIVDIVNRVKTVNGYAPVARIEWDDKLDLLQNLENVYRIMQNGVVTDSWTLMPPDGLTPFVSPINHEGVDYGHRSMSMGDMVEYGGNQYTVATFGFFDINKKLFLR